MSDEPDSTAVRTALWRALHVELDGPPPVLDDTLGLRLADPPEGWRDRGDMHPMATRGFRASIVSRGRFVDEIVIDAVAAGVDQYVLLGAGLDTLAERRADLLAHGLTVYEIDRPGTQPWKQRRLVETGIGVPDGLRFVPVDFESGEDWWTSLAAAGFDAGRPAVVASLGVSMYLTVAATSATLERLAGLAPGSTVVMTFLLPIDLVDEADRPGLERSTAGAAASGTPFISLYAPEAMLTLARNAGFTDVSHVASGDLADRYFIGRADGLRPSTGEDALVART